MDLQQQVAARRAEIARQETAERDAAQRAQAIKLAAERTRMEQTLDGIAQDLSQGSVKVRRDGMDLDIERPAPAVDAVGLTLEKLDRLLKKEARRLWSPFDNWLVISLIVAGLFGLALNGLGIILIVLGAWRGHVLNGRYRAEITKRYPSLFAGQAVETPAEGATPIT